MNTTPLRYRPLAEADLFAVATLEAEAFPTPWTADQYRAMLLQGGCFLFGATDGDQLAGYIAVGMQPAIHEMEIYNIAVAQPFRQRGIARKILSLALEAASRTGIRQVFLEVRESNIPARALYASLAFNQTGRRRRYYHSPEEDALVLSRSL